MGWGEPAPCLGRGTGQDSPHQLPSTCSFECRDSEHRPHCVHGLMPSQCLLLLEGDGETVWNSLLHSSRGPIHYLGVKDCRARQPVNRLPGQCGLNRFHPRFSWTELGLGGTEAWLVSRRFALVRGAVFVSVGEIWKAPYRFLFLALTLWQHITDNGGFDWFNRFANIRTRWSAACG